MACHNCDLRLSVGDETTSQAGTTTCYECGFNRIRIKAGLKLKYKGLEKDAYDDTLHVYSIAERFNCPSCDILLTWISTPCSDGRAFYELDTVKEKAEYN